MFSMFSTKTFANDDGTTTILLNGQNQTVGFAGTQEPAQDGRKYSAHTITIDAGDNVTGNITFGAIAYGRTTAEDILGGDDLPLVLNLANELFTIPLGGGDKQYPLIAITVTLDTLGGDDPVTVSIASGN